jgi:uncharacterized protein (DUF4415 family)
MWTDPIVEEIRRDREAYAAKFNYDLEAIVADIRRQELGSGHEIVTLPLQRFAAEAEEAMNDEYDFNSAKRGPIVPLPEHQTEVRLRLDNEVLDWLKEHVNEAGGSYHEMLNAILRTHIHTQKDDPHG